MSRTHARTPRWVARLVAGALALAATGITTGIATAAAPPAARAATTPQGVVALAAANVGDMACSGNSLGGTGYGSSCTGNGGSPEYWCADFAIWVWQHSGVGDLSGLTPAARSFYTYGTARGILSGTPHPGDVAVFSNNAGDTSPGPGGIHHVAIVSQVGSDGSIRTISGDWDGKPGSEAVFAGSSHVVANAAYSGAPGSYSNVMHMWIVGYVTPPGMSAGSAPHGVVEARSADGRLEMFAGGSDGVWHAYQTAASGGWADWANLGGPANASLTLAPSTDGRLELFAVNGNELDHLYQTAASGGWSSWENFGGGGYDVAMARNADGRLELFASNGGGIYHNYQVAASNGWAGWSGLTGTDGVGGPGNSRLVAAPSSDGRLEVFALNGSQLGHIYEQSSGSNWSNWDNSFGGGGFDLALGRNADGRLELFASNGGGIYHNYQVAASNGWSGWSGLTGTDGVGGPGDSKLTVAPSSDGRLEVFAVNGTALGHIYEQSAGSNWSTWDNGFGSGGSNVVLGKNADGRLDLAASNGGGIYHNYQTAASGGWSGWSSLVGPNNQGGPGIG